MAELSHKSASNLELSLTIPPQKLCGWFRRPQLWATGDWQLHHDNAPTHASRFVKSFLAKHQITQVTQPHYNLDLVPCDFWLFPKLKSPLKGKRFQTIDEIQENMTGQLTVTWTVWGPRCPLWRALRCHCPTYNVSCILYLLQWMSLFFLLHGCIPSGETWYKCRVCVYRNGRFLRTGKNVGLDNAQQPTKSEKPKWLV